MGKTLKRQAKRNKELVERTDIDAKDMAITLRTLARLSKSPALLQSPAFSLIKAEINNCLKAKPNHIQNITDALMKSEWDCALLLISQSLQHTIPKLGTVQRWISLAGGCIKQYELINAIIRISDPSQIADPINETIDRTDGILNVYAAFSIASDKSQNINKKFAYIENLAFQQITIESHIPIHIMEGDACIQWDVSRSEISRIQVPFVQQTFILNKVLTASECYQLMSCSDKIGFTDQLSYAMSEKIVKDGAQGCVWLVNESIVGEIYSRVKDLLPQFVKGRPLAGLNSRFRFYRYSNNALYRPHIDGSWPGSGVVDGRYKFDAKEDEWSCLTLLIYLNDDFKGGQTSFFFPRLNCKGIEPHAGCILVFPHGDSCGALVHEGSQVTEGFKYIIRTDVLYKK